MTYSLHEIAKKCIAIVQFGPPTDVDGMRPATYYQVTIDPGCISPSGEYIRFGAVDGDEIMGWQRCAALTVVEILGEWEEGVEATKQALIYGTQGKVAMLMKDADG